MPRLPRVSGRDAASPRSSAGRAHPARVYDWWLGGRDNYLIDEETARAIAEADPSAVAGARANRRFMHRATRALALDGIRQFLDIGTGIPTEPNLHQVAQSVAPDARVVYVDNDPVVLRHAEARLASGAAGSTAFVQADVRDHETLMTEAARSLDLTLPVALSVVAVMHYVTDEQDAYDLLHRYLDALAPGSHLVLSHVTSDMAPEVMRRATEVFHSHGMPFYPRTREQVARFFTGLDLLDPGLVPVLEWRPRTEDGEAAGAVPVYVGVGRKG